ncbi:hypothetical protein ACFE04_007450 [Oxalis oulophora]
MKSLKLLLLTLIMITMVDNGVQTDLHRVGDMQGWTQNVNYTEWSSRQHIPVGDWIIFNFDKHIYTVFEVNKTSYETCNEQGFIKNITRGGRDVFQLTEEKAYYFISGGGYCWNGMKLALNVYALPPTAAPAPPPTKTKSDSSSIKSNYNWIILVLIALISKVLC